MTCQEFWALCQPGRYELTTRGERLALQQHPWKCKECYEKITSSGLKLTAKDLQEVQAQVDADLEDPEYVAGIKEIIPQVRKSGRLK